MSAYKDHAMMEFRAAGWLDENDNYIDSMQEAICKHILDLLKVFHDEGHSGTTAPYTINLFKTLAMFEPIVPLSGKDDEWVDHGYCKQNKRCSRVFMQADRYNGQAYDIEGIVFYDWYERDLYPEEEGYPGIKRYKSYFTSSDSHVPITFPYTPKSEYKERIAE